MPTIGQEYDWKKQEDGNFTIFNFPIFQETVDKRPKRRGKSRSIPYGSEWIKKAVSFHQVEEIEGLHAPSVHHGHNEQESPELEKIGTMTNFRVGEHRGRDTIFVDIVDMDPAAFAKFKAGKLPHFSVEIPDPETPRIGSGAFLSSRAPYFTLPNAKAGKRVFKRSLKPAFFHANGKHEIIFSQETFMPDDKKKEIQLTLTEGREEERPEMMQEEVMEEEMGGGDVESRVAALEQKMDKIMEMLAPEKEETPPPVSDVDEGSSMSAEKGLASQIFALKESVDKYHEKTEKRLNSLFHAQGVNQLEKEIQVAINRLEAQNIAYGDPQTFAEEVRKRHKERGPKAVEDYINDIETFAHRFSTDTITTFTADQTDEFAKEYTGEEAEVARGAAKFALAKGEDPKKWIPGAVSEFRVTGQKPNYIN